MKAHDSLLIVDDVFDSGRSLQALIDKLKLKLGDNYPHDVRIGTVFYKPLNNKTEIVPNYFCKETTDWLVFALLKILNTHFTFLTTKHLQTLFPFLMVLNHTNHTHFSTHFISKTPLPPK